MSQVSNENFYVVKGWMVNELKLKGSELSIFAIVYGFSQDGESEFCGSIKYLQDFTGLGRTTVINTLKTLTDNKLLIKTDNEINGVNHPKYRVNKNCTGSTKIVRGSTNSVPYNIVKSNTPSINSISKDIELKDEEYKGKGTLPSSLFNTTKSLENNRKNYITGKVEEVVAHLNKVTNKKYSSKTPQTNKLITARLDDGYTTDDMKKVIDHRWQLWKGTEMEQYVRPSTLFRPGNFENYLNSLGTKRKVGTRGCPDTLSIFGVDSQNAYNLTEDDKKLSEESF